MMGTVYIRYDIYIHGSHGMYIYTYYSFLSFGWGFPFLCLIFLYIIRLTDSSTYITMPFTRTIIVSTDSIVD
jgi:hypothetical protein